jgi:hypothetical protein
MTRLEIRACYPANIFFVTVYFLGGFFNFFSRNWKLLKGTACQIFSGGRRSPEKVPSYEKYRIYPGEPERSARQVVFVYFLWKGRWVHRWLIVDCNRETATIPPREYLILTCHPKHFSIPRRRVTCILENTRVRIFKLLRIPIIYSKESISQPL